MDIKTLIPEGITFNGCLKANRIGLVVNDARNGRKIGITHVLEGKDRYDSGPVDNKIQFETVADLDLFIDSLQRLRSYIDFPEEKNMCQPVDYRGKFYDYNNNITFVKY